MSMKLNYYIPFRAQVGQDAQLAVKENLINIEGTAIDASVNTNKWQVPEEDLDFFAQSLEGAQMRIDHAESALAVIDKVPEARRNGQEVLFRGEIGDATIIQKVLRGYLTHVSVQVDSDNVECSKCHEPSRKEGILVHLCPGAWEIVHKPRVRELSIVASPAYKNTEFKPVGFAAAMNASQKKRAQNDYEDVVKRFLRVNEKLNSLMEMERDTQMLKLEDLGLKIAKMKRDEAKVAKDQEYLHAESEEKKPGDVMSEFIRATRELNLKQSTHTAMQLEKLFEYKAQLEAFGDFFGYLKTLSG